ncbi:hypothetical protein FOQG_16995, partial [Fusarium oxysporum f. sp. raphani 54005]
MASWSWGSTSLSYLTAVAVYCKQLAASPKGGNHPHW